MKRYIKEIDSIDDRRFNWWISAKSSSILPYAVLYDGSYYKICNFNKSDNEFIIFEVDNIIDIINISTAPYFNISLLEVANIGKILADNGADFRAVDIMKSERITNDYKFATLLSILKFNDGVKRVLSEKRLPLKSIDIMSKLNIEEERFLSDYLANNRNLSYQDIKLFLEDLIIYRDSVKGKVYSKDFRFPKKIYDKHSEVDMLLSELNQMIAPIKITVDDNYESGEIKILASVNRRFSFADYSYKMNKNHYTIEQYFEIIKRYGLY